MEIKLSFGKSIRDPNQLEDVPLSYIEDQIKSNSGLAKQIESIRKCNMAYLIYLLKW